MYYTGQQVLFAFKATDNLGALVGGLVNGDFAKTLEYLSGSTWVSAPETVTATAKSPSGNYVATFTPTLAATYRLTVIHATYGTNPYERQFDVVAGFATSGPYLTTRANVKLSLNLAAVTTYDDAIDALLGPLTLTCETYCGRVFFEATVDEYYDARNSCVDNVRLRRPPASDVTAVYVSTSLPRVYDATTLLVEGTDWTLDENSECVRIESPRFVSDRGSAVAKVEYTGGYAIIPADIELSVRLAIREEIRRTAMGVVSGIQSIDRGEGQITYSQSAQVGAFMVPIDSKRTWDLYRSHAVV